MAWLAVTEGKTPKKKRGVRQMWSKTCIKAGKVFQSNGTTGEWVKKTLL